MKPLWLVGAALVVAALVHRRRRVEPTLLIGGLLVAAAMAVYGTGLVELPNIEDLLLDIGEHLGAWTYLLVGALAFLETGAFVGLIAPGETAMLLGGLVAGQGHIDVLTLIAIVWAAAIAGDVTSFYLGRRLGRTFLVRHGPRFQITEERLVTVEGFFERHGGKAILIGRFVGIVRAIAPFLAGSSGMSMRRFLPYDVIGAGLWGSTFVLLGYIFWASFDSLIGYAKTGALALGTVIVLVVAVVWVVRWLRAPEHRRLARAWLHEQAQRPVVRPFARVAIPIARRIRRPLRFLWDRVTPGELGLELTTLLAVVAVGSFVFITNTIRVSDGDVPFGDVRALHWADDLHLALLVDGAKVVSVLGALPVMAAVVAATGLLLAARREMTHAIALLAGLLTTVAAVQITAAAIDRSPPANALVSTAESSFPAGPAAYAIGWIAVAVVLARALPGLASRFAFVTVGVVLAALVGLARVYLRASHLSDVAAGWSLAAMLFALCAMAALIVVFVRENGLSTRPDPAVSGSSAERRSSP